MKYLDPIAVLKLNNFDPDHIRKTKKRRLSEIQLSDDGELEYAGGNLTRSEVLGLFAQLESDETREHYSTLGNRRKLSSYLQNGDLDFFESKDEDNFESKSFIRFLSDFFPNRYSSDFLKAYQTGDVFKLKVLSQRKDFLNHFSADSLYESTLARLREIPKSLKEIQYAIDEENDGLDHISILKNIEEGVNVPLINLLPDYFNGVRTNIGQAMRNLSVSIYNELGEIDLAINLISKATSFKLDEHKKQQFVGDLDKLAKIKRDRSEEEFYKVELEHYSRHMMFILEMLEELQNESITEETLEQRINQLGDFSGLNELPGVFDSIRDQLATGLRAVSVSIYNTFSRVDLATRALKMAGAIKVSSEVRKNIKEARRQLADAGRERAGSIVESTELMVKAVKNVPFGSSINVEALEAMISKVLSEEDLRFIAGIGGKHLSAAFENLKFLAAKITVPVARKLMNALAASVNTEDNSYVIIKEYSDKLNSSSVFGRKVEHQVKRTAAHGAATATGIATALFYRFISIAIFIAVLAIIGTIADSCN